MAVSSNADDYDRSEGHGKELCLLSLDGGGVRGLSSLCELALRFYVSWTALINALRHSRRADAQDRP